MSESNFINCMCCGKPMEVKPQRWTHKPPTYFVTCETPECPALGYTVDAPTYHEKDMWTYGTGKKAS